MTHNREKKALYEVMSKATWPKPHPDKTLEPPQPEGTCTSEHPIAKLAAHGRTRWLNKPRILQINAGRIEISISYQLAIALLLGLILLILIAFQLGRGSQKITGTSAKAPAITQKAMTGAPRGVEPAGEKMPVGQKVGSVTVKPKGDNRIVIQSYQLRADLEPVKQYFAQFGIETEIMKIDAWYYLVTKDKYENPERPGTDGYLAKQKIIELGAKYKAPAGYETFGSKPFNDAYGKKFSE